MEPAIELRIRPVVGALRETAAQAAQASVRSSATDVTGKPMPGTQFATRGHSGGNRVTDHGPGADHATVAGRFGFADLLDIVNPLQHIPVVSSFYRELSGDTISSPARVLGDMLYGGPTGLAFAAVNTLFAEVAGKTPADVLVSALLGGADGPATANAPPTPGRPEPPIPESAFETGARPRVERDAPLTGRAALEALVSDMRALERSPASAPAAAEVARPAPGRAFPIRPQDRAAQPYAVPDARPPASPRPADAGLLSAQQNFAQKMLTALDKYEALARAGKDEPVAKGTLLDQGL